MKSRVRHPAVALFLLAACVQLADAQTTVRNVDWQPWYGCWQADGTEGDQLLCIVGDGQAVRMITLVDGAIRADTRIMADGQSRRTELDGCTNEESARWSRDHKRVFLVSDVQCPNGVTRNVRGMLTFTSYDEWLSVQTVHGPDGAATRAVRFTPVEGARIPGTIAGALRSAATTRVASYAPVDEDDVAEAATYLDAGAIDEWMSVIDAPYRVAEGAGSGGSALDQVGRMSYDVHYDDREVVRVVERPVYVVRSYGYRTYGWGWTPWGYDHFGWRGVDYYYGYHYPIVINIGTRTRWYDRDHWRSRGDYGHYDRSRDYGRDRDYGSDYDRDNGRDGSRDGRATREGYTRDRSVAAPQATRERSSSSRSSQPSRSAVSRGSSSTRSAAQPQRAASSSGNRPAVTRTARPRSTSR